MTLKCDYEKAWKELKEEYGEIIFKRRSEKDSVCHDIGLCLHLNILMDVFEKKHTNIIDIRRRSNEEVAGFFMRKYMNLFMKYINLKNRLKKLSQKSMDEKIEISYFRYELNQIYQSIKRDIEECK